MPIHENVLRLRRDVPAECIGVTSNVTERRSSEAFYVNIPSAGLRGQQLRNESLTGYSRVKSRSADNVAEEASYDDSLDLVITEPDYGTELSDSQKCNCYHTLSDQSSSVTHRCCYGHCVV